MSESFQQPTQESAPVQENNSFNSQESQSTQSENIQTENNQGQESQQNTQQEQNTSSYFETNFNPLSYQETPQYQQPVQQPYNNFYQQPQPQYQQPVYSQPQYQQQQQYQHPQQMTNNQTQQFKQMNNAEQQAVKQAISLGIDNETAIKYMDNEDYAGFSDLIAQKIIDNMPQQQQPNIDEIVNNKLQNYVHEQEIKQLDSRITQSVVQSLAKEGLNLSKPQQDYVRNLVTPVVDNAFNEYQNRCRYTGITQGMPHNNGRPLTEEQFFIEYSKYTASKVFGNQQKSNAPNQVIRQNMNSVHTNGSPIINRGRPSNDEIKAMSDIEWTKYKSENGI